MKIVFYSCGPLWEMYPIRHLSKKKECQLRSDSGTLGKQAVFVCPQIQSSTQRYASFSRKQG